MPAARLPRSISRLLAVAGVIALAPCAAGQCPNCAETGLVACPDCGHPDLDPERRILASAAPDRCRTCEGVGRVPCPASCAPPDGYREAWAAQRDRWHERLRAAGIDEAEDWRWLRVRDLDLAFCIPAGANRARRIPSLCHWLAVAVDTVAVRWRAAVGAGTEPAADAARPVLVLATETRDVDRVCRSWVGAAPGPLGARWHEGSPARLATALRFGAHDEPAAAAGLLAHHASHLWLLRRLGDPARVPPALDAGLAHWTAVAMAGELSPDDGPAPIVCRDFCHGHHPQLPRDLWGGDLGIAARERLERGGMRSLADLLATPARALDLEDHALCFALVDWLADPASAGSGPLTGRSAGQGAGPGMTPAEPRTPLAAWVAALAECRDRDEACAPARLARALGREPASIDAAFAERIRARFARARDGDRK